MPVEIKVPSVGESVTEGILSRWLKKDGDAVRADEPVVEMETDKATQEVVAPAAGTLRIVVPAGETVQVGTVIGRVEEGPAPARAQRPSAPPKEALKAPEPSAVSPSSMSPGGPAVPPPLPATAPPGAMSPSARALAEAKGIDASQLTGTGRGGRI